MVLSYFHAHINLFYKGVDMENEKMDGSIEEEIVDISVILDLLAIGSLEEASLMLESYEASHDEDAEMSLARICVALGSGELVKYIGGEDDPPKRGEFSRLVNTMGALRELEENYLNDQGRDALWRFLGEYLRASLKNEKVDPEQLLSFLNTLSEQERRQILVPYSVSGCSAVKMLSFALSQSSMLAFAADYVEAMYAYDKKAYGREALALGSYYVSVGRFKEGGELLTNASYHLDELTECRFQQLLVAVEARNEDEFVHAKGFSKSMKEYTTLILAAKGQQSLMCRYINLADRNVANTAPSAPKAAPAPAAPTSAPKKNGKGCLIVFLSVLILVALIGVFPDLFDGIGCADSSLEAPQLANFEYYEDGLKLVHNIDEFCDGETYKIPSEYNGYPIRAIGDYAIDNGECVAISIPESVRYISDTAFLYCGRLERIEVNLYNPYFSSEDGVLYTDQGATLVSYPRAKSESEFFVPSRVSRICTNAFARAENLWGVYVPKSVTRIDSCAFTQSGLTVFLEHEQIPAGFSYDWADGMNVEYRQEMLYYARIGNYIYFGEYPQSIKSYDVEIYENMTDARGYYLGSDGAYYAKVEARSCSYEGNYTIFSNGDTMYDGVVYYFKVEPLRWRILEEWGEQAILLCDSIIAASMFGYTNNYKGSTVRQFLLQSFLPQAFDSVEQAMIYTTTVDNSIYSTGRDENPFVCEDTEDKVFLLSMAEATDSYYGFLGEGVFDEKKVRYTTDYAMAVGALTVSNGTGDWWLRSPYNGFNGGAAEVLRAGEACYYCSSSNSGNGVVPALRLNLAHTEHYYENGICTECGATVYTREDNYIYMGECPQSIKASDVEIISDAKDSRGYYLGSDGHYYVKVIASPYGSDYTFSSGSSITSGATYYFKVEPIRWRILTNDGDTALLLCDSILTNVLFDESSDDGTLSNNYAQSTIREALNGELYEIAFDDRQKNLILTTMVDNSEYSTGYNFNPYACETTWDDIFLLSYREVTNANYGFAGDNTADTARQIKTSDYARARGVWMSTDLSYYGNGAWWLRSPSNAYENYALGVDYDGNTPYGSNVSTECGGLVPAMRIALNHVHMSAFREQERTEADCENNGSYLSVEYCELCGEVFSSMWVDIPAEHTFENSFTCSVCGETAEYYRDGEYLYFGEYPQSLKTDDVMILSDSTDSRGYYYGTDGYYYKKVIANPYGDGYCFSTGATVFSGETYYFKVEPIRWRILSDYGDRVFLLCDSIIEGEKYDSAYSPNNNYAQSTIRQWLNEVFYQTAFGELQRELILTTYVDNSEYSTGYDSNAYACEDTEDKIFLLSYAQTTNSEYGFGEFDPYGEALQRESTDYARADGVSMQTDAKNYANSYWWLRSPDHYSYHSARVVSPNGTSAGVFASVSYSGYGVVPAMWIRL